MGYVIQKLVYCGHRCLCACHIPGSLLCHIKPCCELCMQCLGMGSKTPYVDFGSLNTHRMQCHKSSEGPARSIEEDTFFSYLFQSWFSGKSPIPSL